MAAKLFLDSNIVLDYLLGRKDELDKIEQLINLTNNNVFDCYISETVISTCIYFLEKNKKQTLEMLRAFCMLCKTLPYHSNILFYNIERFNDIEDGFLYYLALHHKMNFFITRNIKHFKFQLPSLAAMTPTQFLNFYNSGNDLS
ncbi:MAG TPA: PIN domain-containing protein [Parafilimonas sp.]